MSLDLKENSAPLDPFHTVLRRRKAGMETENIKKTFTLSQESAAIIQSVRTPSESTEGEVLNKILREYNEIKSRSGASSEDIKSEFSILESMQEVLKELKGTITELNRDIFLAERKDFQFDLEKIHSMIRSHKSSFGEMEKNLQVAYESVSKGITGMRTVLPHVQSFSDELEGFRKAFEESLKQVFNTNEEELRKYFHNVFEKLQKIEARYETHLKLMEKFPDAILQKNKEMISEFENHRELLNEEYAQRTAKIGSFLDGAQEKLEKKFKAFRLSAYILMGIPALSLLCGGVFLWFSKSSLDKIAVDEALLSYVRPIVENFAKESLENQTAFLLSLKKESEAKINDLVIKEGERVANAVAQYRNETEKSFRVLGEYKSFAATTQSELKEAKSKVNSLQNEVSQLNKKIQGRFGFFDVLKENFLIFSIVFVLIFVSSFFLGRKFGGKFW
jgi:hypothetical protein